MPVNEETRGKALADILAGKSLHEVARTYGVSRQAVQQWRDKAGLAPALPPESKGRVAAALDRHVITALDILTEQIKKTGQANWLNDHGIEGFAQLFRILSEGVARVVEAQEVAAAEAEPEPTPLRRTG